MTNKNTKPGTAVAAVPAARSLALTNPVMAIVPTTIDDVYRFAGAVALSGLAPRGMQTKEQVTVAILHGLELGVKPMQAIQGIAVIGGRPCVWGDLALAIVRSSGELEYIRESYEGEEPDWTNKDPAAGERRYKAICKVKRVGEDEVISEFSVGDAVVGKLWHKRGNQGQDTPWITTPKRMLKMRARGFALRDTFTDVLRGMSLAEELVGHEDDMLADRDALEPPPPTGPRQGAIAHTPEPELEDAMVVETAKGNGPAPERNAQEPVEDAEIVSEESSGIETAAVEYPSPERDAPILEAVKEAFTVAQQVQDVDDVMEAHQEDIQRLTRSGYAVVEELYNEARLRLETKDEPLPAAESPADEEELAPPPPRTVAALDKDPFAIPAKWKGGGHYHTFMVDAIKAAGERGEPSELRRVWGDTKSVRADLKGLDQLSASDIKGLLNRVTEALTKLEESDDGETKGGEPEPELAPPPTTAKKPASDTPAPGSLTGDQYTARLQEVLLKEWPDRGQLTRWWISTPEKTLRESVDANDALRAAWLAAYKARQNELPVPQ